MASTYLDKFRSGLKAIQSGVYLWRNKITNQVLVGQTDNFTRRLYEYKSKLSNGTFANKHFQSSWNKHTSENFEFIVLELVENPAFLTSYEQSYLDYYRTLPGGVYNQIGPADNPTRGRKRSLEEKERMSISRKGRPSPKKGRSLNEEEKARHNLIHKGKKMSAESRLKMSLAKKGKPRSLPRIMTQDIKDKISSGLKKYYKELDKDG